MTIGIENHGSSLIQSPDSIKWLAEFRASGHLGVALASYHLPQDSGLIANLIVDLGERLVHFYAWQYGMGCQEKLPKEQELLQLPGRGSLDFVPIAASLRKINYKGWTEIFMHPVPRGIPIMPTAAEVTEEINHSRQYLERCKDKANGALQLNVGILILTALAATASGVKEALPIGDSRQVFIDGRFVEEGRGVELVVHRPQKTGQIVLKCERPWEERLGQYTNSAAFRNARRRFIRISVPKIHEQVSR